MSTPLLKLAAVTRRFLSGDKDVVVLNNVNLSIDAGEIVAIVGASGSGKSTLMNILGCLDHPSEGTYTVGGRDTHMLDSDELAQLRREHFGFVFQRYHLLPHVDAVANLEMPAIYAGTTRTERHKRARELLARLGLADRAHHRPGQLSGGQQQRVSIARALMNGGQVILADEPTGALDTKSGQDVLRILHELNALGHTIVIVTHDKAVARHARRIIEIRDGEIVADRPNRHYAEALAEAGIGAVRVDATADAPPAHNCDDALPPVANDTCRQRFTASTGRFAEACRMAWIALVSHRLRTLLTMLGIIT
ncbi:MAG: ATP-binding cassette domain-containing protein, partial [Paraburkholderia sp.]|uniref:ATP-binding cassette domain-containing protein n=1 Tax=Paraburkholderia sp. TaxID=1926495 RepID=UPI00120607A9